MQQLKIAHKDIKPDNIILGVNCKDFKVADFGISKDYTID